MTNFKTTGFTIAAIAAAALTTPAHAAISGDGIASFDIGSQLGSNDLVSDTDGLIITGQVGTWAHITTTSPSATDDGVTLTFSLPGGGAPVSNVNWGGTAGDNRGTGSTNAIRIGSFLSGSTDIAWALTGLDPNGYYDIAWYNKRVAPGENRHPNAGIAGFDAGNGIGAAGPLDADKDQNFQAVQADGSGTISGTWFLAGGLDDITAVTGVQVRDNPIPEPASLALLGLGGLMMLRRK
jgi:hypothetical protein